MIYNIPNDKDWQYLRYIFVVKGMPFNIFVSVSPTDNEVLDVDESSKKYLNILLDAPEKKTKEINIKDLPETVTQQLITRVFKTGIRKI